MSCVTVCKHVSGWWFSNPPPPRVPFSCSSLMSQGWLIWPWAAVLARQEQELPRLRAPLNWICKTIIKKKTSRGLIDISAFLLLPPTPDNPLLPSSFIQSTPVLICSPWWEEIYQDAVSLTSLSDRDRNRISKCLTSLWKYNFKCPSPPPPPPSSTSLAPFQKSAEGGSFMESTCVMRWLSNLVVWWKREVSGDISSSFFCESCAHCDLYIQNKPVFGGWAPCLPIEDL